MPDQIDASALDAIEAVAQEGLKRNRSGKRNFLQVVLLIIFFIIIVVGFVLWLIPEKDSMELQPLHDWPVAVLLPDRESSSVVENANRQWKGFELAFSDYQVAKSDQHIYEYDYEVKGEAGDNTRIKIMEKLKGWHKEGIRIFVITMSGATLLIKEDFKDWVMDLPANEKPVLVATVASAPKIVDLEHGIFRHYIRSKDESGVLATYIESINAQAVGVFYVNDPYGIKAEKTLDARLSKNSVVYPDPVELGTGEMADIHTRVKAFIDKQSDHDKAVAVIIGYGSMIKNTLAELDDKFAGDILVVSTFTEEAWRPELSQNGSSLASRIRFVGPGTVDNDEDKRGVVFQFSYLTLARALTCRDERGVEAFWACWKGAPGNLKERGEDWAQVEFTADGDSHVSLQLLKVDE